MLVQAGKLLQAENVYKKAIFSTKSNTRNQFPVQLVPAMRFLAFSISTARDPGNDIGYACTRVFVFAFLRLPLSGTEVGYFCTRIGGRREQL